MDALGDSTGFYAVPAVVCFLRSFNACENCCSVSRLRVNGQLSIYRSQPLLHAGQAESISVICALWIEASSRSCTLSSISPDAPVSDTSYASTPLYFTALCRASCKTRKRQRAISFERPFGIRSQRKSIFMFCRSDSSLQSGGCRFESEILKLRRMQSVRQSLDNVSQLTNLFYCLCEVCF